jgi:hypothetical protein
VEQSKVEEKSFLFGLNWLCMAVESSWSDLFPEKLVTGETLPAVAKTKF